MLKLVARFLIGYCLIVCPVCRMSVCLSVCKYNFYKKALSAFDETWVFFWYHGLVVWNVKLSQPQPLIPIKFNKNCRFMPGLFTKFVLLTFANENIYRKFVIFVYAPLHSLETKSCINSCAKPSSSYI